MPLRLFRRGQVEDPLTVLRVTRLMQSEDEGEAFERALEQLAERMDPRDLPALHLALDDRTEQPERMWGLVHLIEDFDQMPQVAAYLETLLVALPTAREWMETLLIRWVNDDFARATLIGRAKASKSETRDGLMELLREIANGEEPVAMRARDTITGIGLA